MHAADLSSKYAYQGLDVMEMRAVFLACPDTFLNDGDGKKAKVGSGADAGLDGLQFGAPLFCPPVF